MIAPLFIPLAGRYFNAFLDGSKTEEWRLAGPRWGEQTCQIGRRVILSRGYSGDRVEAEITGFSRQILDSETYGPARELAVIRLRVLGSRKVPPPAGSR